MFSSVTALRGELRDGLVAAVPAEWEVVKDLMAANVSLVPAVYLEFQSLSGEADGVPLPRGQMAAAVDIIVVDPRTADGEAEAAIEEEVVPVIAWLDGLDDIGWSTATKIRQETGPLSWRISTIALVNLTDN